MGVYYYFFNLTRNYEQNQHVLHGRFCDHVTKFDSDPIEVQIDLFKRCIKLNEWDENDVIIAVPDYYDHNVMKYSLGETPVVSVDNTDKQKFFEKREC